MGLRVPRATGNQVQGTVGPNVQVASINNEETFNGGASFQKLTSAAASAGLDMYKKAKQDADETAFLEADKQLSAYQTELLYKPETGAFNLKGKQAFGSIETVNDSYNSRAAEIEASLSNETQKAAFRKSYMQRANEINSQLNRHVSAERQKYELETASAYVDETTQAALADPYNKESIDNNLQRARIAIYNLGVSQGQDEITIKQNLSKVESNVHVGIVSKMVNTQNDMDAKTYFENNKSLMLPQDVDRAASLVKAGSIRGESQRISDQVFAESGSMSSALAKAAELTKDNPELRDATNERIRQNYAQAKLAKQDAAEKNMSSMADVIDRGGTLNDIPVQRFAALSPAERESMRAYAMKKAKGESVITDETTWYDLKTMSATNPNAFVGVNLQSPEVRNKLSSDDWRTMVDLQAGLRKGDSASKDLANGYLTEVQIVDRTLTENGFDVGNDANKTKMAETNNMRRQVEMQIVQLQKQTGKKASNADIQKIVDGLMVETLVRKRSILPDVTKRRGEISIDDVPASELKLIKSSKRYKANPTNQEAVRLWLLGRDQDEQ